MPNFLTEHVGPLPVWAWGGIGAVGVGAFMLLAGPKRTVAPDPMSQQGGIQGSASGDLNSAAITTGLSDISQRTTMLDTTMRDMTDKIIDATMHAAVSLPAATAQLAAGGAAYTNANDQALAQTDSQLAQLLMQYDPNSFGVQVGGQFIDALKASIHRVDEQAFALQAQTDVAKARMSQPDANELQHRTDLQIQTLRDQHHAAWARWDGLFKARTGQSIYDWTHFANYIAAGGRN